MFLVCITVVLSSTPSVASSSSSFTFKANVRACERVKVWDRKLEASAHVHGSRTHFIVVRTEVLEMAEAGVADADEDGDAQSYQREQRRGGPEP